MERVQKIISNAGYCSRRKAETLIAEGRVKVNNNKIKLGDKASDSDIITIDGTPLRKEKKLYIMINKPKYYLCALTDISDKRLVTDLIDVRERIYPIGRLDYNTEGLLLLTNDGDFANRIMHPRYETKKTYVASLDRKFMDLAALDQPIYIEGKKVRIDHFKKLKPDEIEITLHEGKKHIVKKILKTLGYHTTRLIRTKLGPLTLDLKPGRYRSLTQKEIDMFDHKDKDMDFNKKSIERKR